MTDDELTDAREAGAVFPGGVSHLEHLRIAWVLHQRHGPEEARRRLVGGTERACAAHGCPEKFDAALTERWARAIAEAAGRDGLGSSADSFIAAHPQLQRGDLFGSPDPPGFSPLISPGEAGVVRCATVAVRDGMAAKPCPSPLGPVGQAPGPRAPWRQRARLAWKRWQACRRSSGRRPGRGRVGDATALPIGDREESDMSIASARFPAAALVEALRGRTVVDAHCDGEGHDDVHLVLDDGTRVWVDVDVDPNVVVEARGGGRLELGPRGRLVVAVERPGHAGRAT